MSAISEHYSLEKHNSFGFKVFSKRFYEATVPEDCITFFKVGLIPGEKFLILGEGSNVLFTSDFDGTIIHPAFKGIEVISEDSLGVFVKASSGENWDNFVQYCVERNWSGLENLSLIPGSVGSSPVQNIGAYGVEAKDSIYEVEGFFMETGMFRTFTNTECRFEYRNSIFKQELKNRFLISSVTFKLDKTPKFRLDYGSVEKEFMKKPAQNLEFLRQTIIEIRQSKLPDPSKLGNAGSFFKNPVLSNNVFSSLKDCFPLIPSYNAGPDHTKIPAAWLIEQAGWKGHREGNTGTYPTQPLVIVNYGGATGKEVYELAMKITESVQEKFGVSLQMEVNLI